MNCTSDIFQSPEFLAALTQPNPIVSIALLVPVLLQAGSAAADQAACETAQGMLDVVELALNISAAQAGLPFGSIQLPDLDCGCGAPAVELVGYDVAFYGAAGA